MRRRRWPRAALPTLLAAGCVSGPLPAEQPARVADSSDASRAELQRVVSHALDRDEVLLADDALTTSSVLLVERRKPRAIGNPPLSGRDLGTPERFRLLKVGDRCVLVHEGSARRFELAETHCIPE